MSCVRKVVSYVVQLELDDIMHAMTHGSRLWSESVRVHAGYINDRCVVRMHAMRVTLMKWAVGKMRRDLAAEWWDAMI